MLWPTEITADCLPKITLWYDGWAQVIYVAVILLCQKTKWREGEETEGRNNPIFYGLMAPPTRTWWAPLANLRLRELRVGLDEKLP